MLKYCIYCVSTPSLHRECTDSLTWLTFLTDMHPWYCTVLQAQLACLDGRHHNIPAQSRHMGHVNNWDSWYTISTLTCLCCISAVDPCKHVNNWDPWYTVSTLTCLCCISAVDPCKKLSCACMYTPFIPMTLITIGTKKAAKGSLWFMLSHAV